MDNLLRLAPGGTDPLSAHIVQLGQVFERAADFDVIHCHVDYLAFPFGRLVPTRRQFPFVTQGGSFGTASFEEFTRRPGDLNLLVGAAGVRYNPRGTLLISAQVLVPITESGLRDRITPVIGIDYSF